MNGLVEINIEISRYIDNMHISILTARRMDGWMDGWMNG